MKPISPRLPGCRRRAHRLAVLPFLFLSLVAAVGLSQPLTTFRIEATVTHDDTGSGLTGTPILAKVTFDANDFFPGGCCGGTGDKISPISMLVFIGADEISTNQGGINIVNTATWDGWQAVDEGMPVSGTLAGFGVTGASFNFQGHDGDEFDGIGLTDPLDLPEWEVANGIFVVADGHDSTVGFDVSSFRVEGPSQCPSGVIGYWPLDGNGTESVNGFPGSLVGNVSFVPGVVGQAGVFDGDVGSYVDAGVHPELTDFGGNQMSVGAWVLREADGTAGDPDSAIITSRTFCNEGNFQLYATIGSNVYYSKWLNGAEDQTFASFGLPIGQWAHVVATYSSNAVRFYLDGVLVDTVTPLPFGGAINDFVQRMQVGWDSCGSFFSGRLDEVAVWNVTLNDSEVEDLFEKGLDGVSLCVDDADGDGVTDDLDICPATNGTPRVDGCDCEQILAFKPGLNLGESPDNCSAGTIDTFEKRIGWARDVPRP